MTADPVAAAIAWVVRQPSDPWSIDAKCLVAALGEVAETERAQIMADKRRLVRAGRRDDGGFRSKYGGDCSTVLWTADAIRWLGTAGEPVDAAVRWLAGRQLADGSWLEVTDVPWGRSWYQAQGAHVWITAAVLQSLRLAPAPPADLIANGQRFLDRAVAQFEALVAAGVAEEFRIALGFDRFSLAVAADWYACAERVFPAAEAAIGYLSRDQDDQGAWEGSTDVTQATAHGLLLLTGDPDLPELAAAESYLLGCSHPEGGWAHHRGDPPDWTLTAYTIRFLRRLAAARSRARELR